MVVDLARKRQWLAEIIHDPDQKTADRLRDLKLDIELAEEADVRDTLEQGEEFHEALRQVCGVTSLREREEALIGVDLGAGI